MVVPGRILAGLLFIFGLFQHSSAETIPFAYWYGRIIGRTQIQAIHHAYTDVYGGDYGSLATSMSVGYGNDVSVNLGTLFDIYEASQSNALLVRPHRPVLSANVALGPRLRWQINRLDWQEDAELSTYDDVVRFHQKSNFQSDQTIRTMRRDIEYDSTRSLYYYTKGMFLQPHNWRLDVRAEIMVDDDSEEWSGRTILPWIPDSLDLLQTSVSDTRRWTLGTVFGYGVSHRFQMLAGGQISRTSQPQRNGGDFISVTNPDSVVERAFNVSDATGTLVEVYLQPTFFQSDRHWASIRPFFRSFRSTVNAETQKLSGSDGPANGVERDVNQARLYELEIEHSWQSDHSPISLRQILDDKTGYYGHRLATGALQIQSNARLSFERRRARHSSGPLDEPNNLDREYKSRSDELFVSTQAIYYAPFNLDLSMGFFLNCRSDGSDNGQPQSTFLHSQNYQFRFSLAYYSYRWHPETRTAIGWDKIKDMDYLYGPLLRTRDWHATISVYPPTHKHYAKSTDETLFNFFKGESDNRWDILASGRLGICEGLDVGLGVTYRQEWADPHYYSSGTSERSHMDAWSISPNFRWQPGSRFRVDFSVLESYSDRYEVYYWDGEEFRRHSYYHTWEISVKYNILI